MNLKAVFVCTLLLPAFLFGGCLKNVKQGAAPIMPEHLVQPAPAPVEEPKPEPPPEPPKEEPEIDFTELPLEVIGVQQLEEKAGLYNSYSPQFSGSEKYIAFEVSYEEFNRIFVFRIDVEPYRRGGKFAFEKVKEVTLGSGAEVKNIEDMFESAFPQSFNYELTWFPKGNSFVFTSNAGLGEYNLFLGSVEKGDAVRSAVQRAMKPKSFGEYLMMTEDLKKDGQAKVSPDGGRIVFTSGRTGNGDLYLLDLASGSLKRLTTSERTDLFPQWSPDGREIVFTSGGKQSHDIHIIRDAGSASQREDVLVRWFFDDVLPTFSPDGKRVSFYTTYNEERDPFNTKRWGLMIIPSDGSAPPAGKELLGYFHLPDVIKDNNQGTAWFPDSRHILYAKSIENDYNPIYIYDVESRTETLVKTGTDINHDITVSPHGLVSFRAQVLGWDRIFVASTTFFQEYLKGTGR